MRSNIWKWIPKKYSPPISDKMVVPLFFLVCLIYMHLIEIFHEGTIYQHTAIKMWQTQSTSLFRFLRRFLSCCFQSCFWHMPYRYYNIMNIYNLCCLNKPKDGETRYPCTIVIIIIHKFQWELCIYWYYKGHSLALTFERFHMRFIFKF